MKRSRRRLDAGLYAVLGRKAFERGWSTSRFTREVLAYSLRTGAPKHKPTLQDFRFVGIGKSPQSRLRPVSERHDETLADAVAEEFRR